MLQNGVKQPWNVPSLIATLLIKRNMIMSQIQRVRGEPYVDKFTERCVLTPRHVENDQTSTGETRHGGSKRGTQNWLQSTRTVKLSCKGSRTSPSSRACTKDRKSSSSSSISSRLAAEWRLQSSQQRFENDDSRIEQCGVIRVVRNYIKSTMFSLSSWLESRNCALHLRTMLDLQRIQKNILQTTTGCNLYPGLRDKERRYPWCSTRQDRGTKRIPFGLECVEEML